MRRLAVAVERLAHAKDLPLPAAGTAGAAGLDLYAALPADEPTILAPGQRAAIGTGIRVVLPVGHEGQVRPRSGLASRHGVTVLNAPGTIDADYRGEVVVILINHGEQPFTVRRGDRVAQLVVAPATGVVWHETTIDIADTARGIGGLGSTDSAGRGK